MSSPSGVNGSGGNGPVAQLIFEKTSGIAVHRACLFVANYRDDAVRQTGDGTLLSQGFEVAIRILVKRLVAEVIGVFKVAHVGHWCLPLRDPEGNLTAQSAFWPMVDDDTVTKSETLSWKFARQTPDVHGRP